MELEVVLKESEAYIREGNFDAAIQLLQSVLAEEPENLHALRHLGVAFTESGKNREAISTIQFYLKMDTGNAQAYEAIGCAHLRLDEYKAAEEYLLQARELEPENPTILRNLSVLYSQTARPEESLELLERSYEISPEDYLTQYALSSAYLFYGRKDEAKKILFDLLQSEVPEQIRKPCEERYLQLSVEWL